MQSIPRVLQLLRASTITFNQQSHFILGACSEGYYSLYLGRRNIVALPTIPTSYHYHVYCKCHIFYNFSAFSCAINSSDNGLSHVRRQDITNINNGMMTSSNGNSFRDTTPLCGEFTKKTDEAKLWCFFVICACTNCWVNNRDVDDLKQYRAHYDVTVMASRDSGERYWKKMKRWTSFCKNFLCFHIFPQGWKYGCYFRNIQMSSSCSKWNQSKWKCWAILTILHRKHQIAVLTILSKLVCCRGVMLYIATLSAWDGYAIDCMENIVVNKVSIGPVSI